MYYFFVDIFDYFIIVCYLLCYYNLMMLILNHSILCLNNFMFSLCYLKLVYYWYCYFEFYPITITSNYLLIAYLSN